MGNPVSTACPYLYVCPFLRNESYLGERLSLTGAFVMEQPGMHKSFTHLYPPREEAGRQSHPIKEEHPLAI